MESVNNKNFKTSLVEGGEILSSFRKRNNILIIILVCFIISLILIIASSSFYIFHNISESDQPLIRLNPATLAYYSFACNTPSCLKILNPISNTKSITDPTQIFTLSLQTAAKELENLTSFMLSNSNTDSTFRDCSDSLRDGLDHIRDALATMQVNPFVEKLSDEQISEMMNHTITAEENLKSCLDDLSKVESTAVNEVREKVLRVKVYVSSGGKFLLMFEFVHEKFWNDNADHDWRSMIFEYLVIVCVCGLYLWFIFYFFRALCRYLGVKYSPLANAFRAMFTGTAILRR